MSDGLDNQRRGRGPVMVLASIAVVVLQFVAPAPSTWGLAYKVAFSVVICYWLVAPYLGVSSKLEWIAPVGALLLIVASQVEALMCPGSRCSSVDDSVGAPMKEEGGLDLGFWPDAPAHPPVDAPATKRQDLVGPQDLDSEEDSVRFRVIDSVGTGVASCWVSVYRHRRLVDASLTAVGGLGVLSLSHRSLAKSTALYVFPPSGSSCIYRVSDMEKSLHGEMLVLALGDMSVSGRVVQSGPPQIVDRIGLVPAAGAPRSFVVPFGFEFGRSQADIFGEGAFTFRGLRPGAYRLLLRIKESGAWISDRTVQAGTSGIVVDADAARSRYMPRLVLCIKTSSGEPLACRSVMLRLRRSDWAPGDSEVVLGLPWNPDNAAHEYRGPLPQGVRSEARVFLEMPRMSRRLDLGSWGQVLSLKQLDVQLR